MKMKNYGVVLAFMAVLSGFLLGGTVHAEDKAPALEKQNANEPSKLVQSKIKTNKTKKGRAKASVTKQEKKISTKQVIAKDSGLQKPLDLDLSIPFQGHEEAVIKNEQSQAAQSKEPNLFAAENKKRQRSLKLDGGVLMSQEPEAEKQRSLDGAGIRLNLNP